MLSRRLTAIIRQYVKLGIPSKFSTEAGVISSHFPDVTIPNLPVNKYVFEHIHKWPNHTAVECAVSGKKYTYSDLHTKCRRFASSLKKLGLKKGDDICISLPNIPEFAVAYLGAFEAGLTVSPMNPNYTHAECTYQLNDCNAEWIICHPSNLAVIKEAKKSMNNLNIICTNDFHSMSPDIDDNVIRFDELIENCVTLLDSSEDADKSDIALISYSSGTTGLPKGACLSHRSIIANLTQISSPHFKKIIETHGNHQDCIPAYLPMFHCYGNIILLLQSLRLGAKLILMPKFDPTVFLSSVENNQNIVLYAVPPIIFFLGNRVDVTGRHLRRIRQIVTGAAPCGVSDFNKVKDKKPDLLISQGYGMTEASGVLTMLKNNKPSDVDLSSVGYLLPNTFAKTISLDKGEVLKHNEIGELLFKGPQLMARYLNNPEATAQSIDADGWLHSGDVGYYDQNGLFYITDRIKELIKVKGFQVAPAELENVLRKYPGIVEAGVVGAPCKRSGEVPVAFVQLEPGNNTTEQEIKDFVASHLSKNKHLSSVKFLPSIPKTASGKILRKVLKNML